MSDATLHPAHPDVELLADHAEGLLSPEQSVELSAHVASCAECRETYEALVELTELLGAEPAPGPMPDDVAARIDAALAAERANPTALEDAAPAGTGAPAAPRAQADAPAAAKAVEPKVGTDEAGDADDANETDAAATDRPARRPAGDRPDDNRPKTRAPGAPRPRRSTRMRHVLTALALFAAAGGIGVAVSRGGDLDSGAGTAESGANVTKSAPYSQAAPQPAYDFTEANLATEVQRLASDATRATAHAAGTAAGTMAPAGTPTPSLSPSGGVGHDTPRSGAQTAEPALPSSGASEAAQPTAPTCVLAATKRTDQPAVQGLGRYLGVEVFALLYPDAADPQHRWDVFLVQNSCAAPLVMLHQSVPRA